MKKAKLLTMIAGTGVLVVAVLAGVYWERIAAWYRFHQLFESIGKNERSSTPTAAPSE